MADDATPEALAEVMAQNGESLGILEAEGGILDTWGGRYSSGIPNLDLVLKSYGAEPVTVDRKGREPLMLRRPRLTVVLTPQPSVLQDAGSNRAFLTRGLIGRCLLCLPRPTVGFRDNSKTMSHALAASWHDFINGLLGIKKTEHPQELVLGAEAFRLWLEFTEAVEVGLRPDGELENISSWGSKSTGQAIRIAGIFHMAGGPAAVGHPIDAHTMGKAIAFVAWAAEHARFAFGIFGSDADQECAKRALAWLQREKVETVAERGIYQALKGKYPKMSQVRPGITDLVDRGALVPLEREYRPGKPSARHAVNPAIYQVRRGHAPC